MAVSVNEKGEEMKEANRQLPVAVEEEEREKKRQPNTQRQQYVLVSVFKYCICVERN